MLMKKEDFSYSYSRTGYTVFYKNQPIYAAGVAREDEAHARRYPSNAKLSKESAERERNRILAGYMCPDTRERIRKIDNETEI